VADALPAFAELSSTEKEKAYKKLDQISAFARRVHAYVREHGLSEEEIGQKSYEIIIQWEDELPTTDRHWGFNLATGRMSPDQVVFYAIPES
jgi:hypothetical protein